MDDVVVPRELILTECPVALYRMNIVRVTQSDRVPDFVHRDPHPGPAELAFLSRKSATHERVHDNQATASNTADSGNGNGWRDSSRVTRDDANTTAGHLCDFKTVNVRVDLKDFTSARFLVFRNLIEERVALRIRAVDCRERKRNYSDRAGGHQIGTRTDAVRFCRNLPVARLVCSTCRWRQRHKLRFDLAADQLRPAGENADARCGREARVQVARRDGRVGSHVQRVRSGRRPVNGTRSVDVVAGVSDSRNADVERSATS